MVIAREGSQDREGEVLSLDDARGPWALLFEQQSGQRFFHQLDYFEAAMESLLLEDRERVRVLHIPGQALLPLRGRIGELDGLPRVRFLESPHHRLIDLYDVLLAPTELEGVRSLLANLDRAAPKGWDVFWLPRVPAESRFLNALRHLAPPGLVLREACESKSVSVIGGYEKVRVGLRHKFLVNERRKLKKLAELGTVEHLTHYPRLRNDPAFLEFLRVEAAGWKGRSESAILRNPSIRAFFERLVERLGPSRGCRIDHLCLNGQPIAVQFGLVCAQTLSLLKIGYDEAYQAMGPGGLLIHETLKKIGGPEDGLEELSFVSGAEWNDAWGARAQGVFDVRIYNRTPIGAIANTMAALKPHVKRGVHWFTTQPQMKRWTGSFPRLGTK